MDSSKKVDDKNDEIGILILETLSQHKPDTIGALYILTRCIAAVIDTCLNETQKVAAIKTVNFALRSLITNKQQDQKESDHGPND